MNDDTLTDRWGELSATRLPILTYLRLVSL